MKHADAMAIIQDQNNTARMLELFAGSMPLDEIAAEFGLSGRSGRMITDHLKSIVGEKTFHERCRRVIREGKVGKPTPEKIKICGECKSFFPIPKRINGIRYGTCKKTGKTVDRCAECRMEGKAV